MELGDPIPPKKERNFIIDIISFIERKIIINSNINKTLEQIVQALLKSWFVDSIIAFSSIVRVLFNVASTILFGSDAGWPSF